MDKEFADFLAGTVSPLSIASSSTSLFTGPSSGLRRGVCPASQTDASCFSIFHGACPFQVTEGCSPSSLLSLVKREAGDDGVQRDVAVRQEPLSCSSPRLGLLLPGTHPGQNFVHRDVHHRGRTPRPTDNGIAQERDGTNQCRRWGPFVKLLGTRGRL